MRFVREDSDYCTPEIRPNWRLPKWLYRAWDEGQWDSLDELGDACVPCDLVKDGLARMLAVKGRFVPIDAIEARWGGVIGCIPSYADPGVVICELQRFWARLVRRQCAGEDVSGYSLLEMADDLTVLVPYYSAASDYISGRSGPV